MMNSIVLSQAEYQQSIKQDYYFATLSDADIMRAIVKVTVDPTCIRSEILKTVLQQYNYTYPSDINAMYKQFNGYELIIDRRFVNSTMLIASNGLPHSTYLYRKYAKLKYLFKTKKIDSLLDDNDIKSVLLDIRVYCTMHMYIFQFCMEDNLKFLNMIYADINELVILYIMIRAMYTVDIEVLCTNICKLHSVLYGSDYDEYLTPIHRKWFFIANYRVLLLMYKYCEKVYQKIKNSKLEWNLYDNFEFVKVDIENEITDFLNMIVDCIALLKNKIVLSFSELKQTKIMQTILKQVDVTVGKYI